MAQLDRCLSAQSDVAAKRCIKRVDRFVSNARIEPAEAMRGPVQWPTPASQAAAGEPGLGGRSLHALPGAGGQASGPGLAAAVGGVPAPRALPFPEQPGIRAAAVAADHGASVHPGGHPGRSRLRAGGDGPGMPEAQTALRHSHSPRRVCETPGIHGQTARPATGSEVAARPFAPGLSEEVQVGPNGTDGQAPGQRTGPCPFALGTAAWALRYFARRRPWPDRRARPCAHRPR